MAETPLTRDRAKEYFSVCLDSIVDVTVAEKKLAGSLVSSSTNSTIFDLCNVTQANQYATAKKLEKTRDRHRSLLNEIIGIYHSPTCNGDTVYDAFNATTEFADHSKAMRYRGERKDETRWLSNLIGKSDEMKTAAFNSAMALTN